MTFIGCPPSSRTFSSRSPKYSLQAPYCNIYLLFLGQGLHGSPNLCEVFSQGFQTIAQSEGKRDPDLLVLSNGQGIT